MFVLRRKADRDVGRVELVSEVATGVPKAAYQGQQHAQSVVNSRMLTMDCLFAASGRLGGQATGG